MMKTVEKVWRQLLWHGLREDFENHVRRCGPCAGANYSPKVSKSPLQRVAIDIVSPIPRSSSGHEWLAVVLDHLTKFAEAFPVRICQLSYFPKR